MILDRARSALAAVPAVFGTVLRTPALRRLELAFAGFTSAEWAVWIALLVYAYGQGGTTEVGIVAVVQLVPAALFAPLASVLGDRYRAGRVLFWSYVAQATGLGLTAAVLLADGPALLVYALGAAASTAITVTRPTMSAFTPALARTPEELTAVNVVSGWNESVSVLVAPAAAGAIMALSEPGMVFAVMTVVVAVSALLVFPEPGPPPAGADDVPDSVASSVGAAFRVLRDERPARLLVILLCADFVALGALDVLYPELAIGVLDRDESWAGYLNAAFGAGAALAVALTAGLVGRRRLMPTMLAGLATYVAAFCLLAAYPTVGTALVLLAVAGAGRVVLDVGARTLLQRVSPSDVLARVFGLLEGLSMAGLAIGSLLVAALVALGGASLAIVGIGLLLPLGALVAGRSLLEIDRHATVPVVEIGLLRSLRLFAPLPPATLESVARSLERVDVAAGTEIIRQGEEGDRYYVIADGVVDVVRDGNVVATLERGDGFGEIALLHAVARTATCVATEPTTLYALEKADFLTALTGHPHSRAEADRLAAARRPEAGATTTVR
jgi:MFS family permease